MSSAAPFRDLPARAKAVLPPWELRKDKEEVAYKLNTCRGLPQNNFHDVSASSIEVHLLLCTPPLGCVLRLCWWRERYPMGSMDVCAADPRGLRVTVW